MATLAELRAEAEEAASYAEDADVAMARAFRTALTKLILRTPEESEQVGISKVRQNVSLYQKQLETVSAWLAENDTREPLNPGYVRFADFGGFRT